MLKPPAGIAFVKSLVSFGESALGLDFGESFKDFESDGTPPQWLYVSERYQIKSVFDYYAHPYIGAFRNKETMESLASGFEKLGFDIYLFTAEAWGGNPCPILPMLLKQSRTRQAYVVLHEGWHITVWRRKIKIPYELEEPIAIAIADIGASTFADKTGDKELLKDLTLLKNTRGRFRCAVNDAATSLKNGYEELAGRTQEDTEAVRKKLLGSVVYNPVWAEAEKAGVLLGGITRFQPINNAFFLRYGTYYNYLGIVEEAVKCMRNPLKATDFFSRLPSPELKPTLMFLKYFIEEIRKRK